MHCTALFRYASISSTYPVSPLVGWSVILSILSASLTERQDDIVVANMVAGMEVDNWTW